VAWLKNGDTYAARKLLARAFALGGLCVSVMCWSLSCPVVMCFLFQAEDGIRYRDVTGVQTCALPILDYFTIVWSNPHSMVIATIGSPLSFGKGFTTVAGNSKISGNQINRLWVYGVYLNLTMIIRTCIVF